jgi:peptide/nickel transport system permease protein
MGVFLLRRLVTSLVLVTVATILGYLLAAASLNPRANYEARTPHPPEASIDHILDALNLNDKTPLQVRFVRWAGGVLHGDLGKTISGQPVVAEVGRRMGVSLRLLLVASLLSAVIGVAAGFIGATRQYRPSDQALTLTSFVVLSMPVFFLATLLKLGAVKVNQAAGTTLLPYTGEYTPGLTTSWWGYGLDRVQHLVVPTAAFVLIQAAFYSRYQRSAMLDVLAADYIRTARSTGLSRRGALIRHGLRTALIPMATFFSYQFGLLLTGAIFTEKIFAWHGMGEWLVDSIGYGDVNAVASIVLFSAVLVLVAGLLSDVTQAILDPRIRTG